MKPTPPTKGQEVGFEVLPTPNPAVFSFRVRMDVTQFKPTTAVAPGTRYAECSFIPQRGRTGFQGFDDYVYTYCSREDNDLWFYFGKKLTPAEKTRPFRTFATNRNYPWPAVLEDMYFVKSSFPQSAWTGAVTVTAPTYLPRYRYRPSVNVDSLCVVQQFLDAVPWDEASMVHEQPIPTDVNAHYIGVSVDFQRCLHGALKFKENVPGASIVFGVGMVDPPPGRSVDSMYFPKTNFTDWTPFVLEDRQEPVNGLYLRELVTIFPPAPPKTIIR